jgi:glycosyltransferase involved in cell wall biosynthesis
MSGARDGGAVTGGPRILQVLHSFGIGGSEIFGLELARELARQGARVMCGALEGSHGPLAQRCAAYGIPVVDLAIAHESALARNGLSLSLTRRLRALQLDAIHLQHFLGLNKLGLPARLAGIRRVVVTEHSIFDVDQSRAGRLRARLNWRLATRITVIHQSIKDYLCGTLGVAPERIEVIPIGIEIDRYQRRDRAECRARLGIGSELVFAFVGRLAPVKDVPGIIAAFLAVQSRRPDASRLIVIGDGPCRGACEDLIRAHRRGSQVAMLGAQADARPFLAVADVLVLNSRSEGTPRALLEALAMGIPGIGPEVGGIPDILRGRGWLTRAGDGASLEAALEFVRQNPGEIESLEARCRDYVRSQFDAVRIAERYGRLLGVSGTTAGT